jgi:disulfide bond formation protein DsbB
MGATNIVQRLFIIGYVVIVGFFLFCGFSLIVMAGLELWHGLYVSEQASLRNRFDSVLESIGLLTIAVAALELGQTVLEEEVLRKAGMSAPTRVRRFLSRFMIVVVVSLSIECMVAVFQLMHKEPALLPQAAMIGVAAAGLMIAWGFFLRQNTHVEVLEPEAMAEVKSEDKKLD